tara:strand:+ start:8351 stop:9097 length:747 start_codon:yes stop_codon:yes gene_type:complete
MSEEKAVTKKPKTEVAKIDFAADANAGLESMTREDLAIPFIQLLQKTSPQVEEVEGAKPGMIYNSVSGKCFEQLDVLPCGYKRSFVEWKPRESGGGYVTEHAPSDAIAGKPRNERGEVLLDNGNILVETAYQFIIFADGKALEQAVIAFSSTQLKKARRWNSIMMGLKVPGANGEMVTPASFSHAYTLKSKQEKNDKGSWHGWDINIKGPVDNMTVYQLAKTFSNSVSSNEVKVSPPQKEEPKVSNDF